MDEVTNAVRLRGTLGGRPHFSHWARDEEFWTFPLEVHRLSGTADRLNILVRRSLLEMTAPEGGDKVEVEGEIRSYRNRTGSGSRLVVAAYARKLLVTAGEETNDVSLRGTLCRVPSLRVTPLGREIADFLLIVTRRYGRSDYLPCIAWGQQAEEACQWPAGSGVALTGRFQSREYLKRTETGILPRTAYEISVCTLALIPRPDGRFPEFPSLSEA